MTIPDQSRRTREVGNNSTPTYNYTWRAKDKNDVGVFLLPIATGVEVELILDVDYTVNGPFNQDTGGTYTVTNPTYLLSGNLPTGDVIVAIGVRVNDQTTSYKNQASYLPKRTEDSFDDRTVISQQNSEILSRAVIIEATYGALNVEASAPQQNGILRYRTTGFDWPTIGELDPALVPNPMSWEGAWVQQEYQPLATVRDGDWTMISNTITSDRAAPLPVGDPEDNTPVEPIMATASDTSVVWTGHLYSFTKSGWVTHIKVYIPELSANTKYRFLIIDETNPSVPLVTVIEEPVLVADAWTTIGIGATLILAGQKIRVVIDAINSSSSTPTVGEWTYNGTANSGAPSTGGWNRHNNDTVVRIDKTDLAAADRTANLLAMDAGSTIRFSDDVTPAIFREFITTADAVDQGTYIEFATILINSVGNITVGNTSDLAGDTPTPSPTQYSDLAAYWPGNLPSFSTIEGFKYYDGVAQASQNNILFGVDITFQEGALSPDWDVVAISSGSSGGGSDPELSKSVNQMASSGLISGGAIAINGSGTTVDISLATGLTVDNYTNPDDPISTPEAFAGVTALVMDDILTTDFTFIGIRNSGTGIDIVQQPTAFTRKQRRTFWWCGFAGHPDHATIETVGLLPNVTTSINLSFYDYASGIGSITEGMQISPNGANLQINRAAGNKIGPDINWINDAENPNEIPVGALAPVTQIFPAYRNGSGGYSLGVPVTTIDVANYDDDSGTPVAVPGNRWTIQRIFAFAQGSIIAAYGQDTYNTITAALNGLRTENADTDPEFSEADLQCFLISRSNTSDLSDGGANIFINTGRFGNIGFGGASGGQFGDVNGPVASTDNAPARYDGVSGTVVQDYISNAPIFGDNGEVTLAAIFTKTTESTVVNLVSYGANQNNYVFTSSTILWNSTTDIDLTGLVPIGANSNTVTIMLRNGSSPLTLVHESTSTDANKINISGALNFTLLKGGDSVTLKYDNSLLRWRIVSSQRQPVYVEASSDAGQVVTAGTELLDYEDVVTNTHGAWDAVAMLFTAPRDKTYMFMSTCATTSGSESAIFLRHEGVNTATGNYRPGTSGNAAMISVPFLMLKGETMGFTFTSSQTRDTSALKNRLYIAEMI